MAKVRVSGKGPHGDFTVEAEVADEHAAAVVASAVEKAHGAAISLPGPRRNVSTTETTHRPVVREPLSEVAEDPFLTAEDATALRSKVPTTEQVEEFILKQPERRHSHPQVAREFFGRTVRISQDRSPAEKRLFYILHRRIEDARARIEKRDRSGKFAKTSTAFGTHREYLWEREGQKAG